MDTGTSLWSEITSVRMLEGHGDPNESRPEDKHDSEFQAFKIDLWCKASGSADLCRVRGSIIRINERERSGGLSGAK